MAFSAIQASFNAGEWAPALYARVDIGKYHSGAALIRNFFVDYRGGVTASPGSRFIIACTSGTAAVRLIPFQASLSVSYVLVFEDQKLYFLNNGAPVLETGISITGITNANPGVISATNSYSNGDRVYLSGIAGMTELNGNYYTVANRTAGSFTLIDMFGNAVDTTTFGTWTSGGTASRIYTVASPYYSTDLAQIKYAQDVNIMELCHPNYAAYTLTLIAATNWTLAPTTIGSTVIAPTGQAVATTLSAGNWHYAYVITAVDAAGQESASSAFATLTNIQDLRTTAGTNTVTWNTVAGAVSYNIYKAQLRSGAAVPAGSMFGYVGNCTGLTFIDSNIAPDFSQGYPIVRNPFSGSGVQTVTVTAPGSYSGGQAIPSVSFSGGGGSGAAGFATATQLTFPLAAPGTGYSPSERVTFSNGTVIYVTSIGAFGSINSFTVLTAGTLISGQLTGNISQLYSSGSGSGAILQGNFGVTSVGVTSPGSGYGGAPTVVFSSGAAAATATLGVASAGNPTVPVYHQQRLGLLGPVAAPNQINFSQPGASFNFNVTDPVAPDNAFQGTLKSGVLNTIQAAISQPQGLIVLADNAAWLLNGGSAGSAFDATNLVANPQIFNGAAALPPIVAVDDVLYVQSKGSIVRDLIFNWNKQVYTGADISVQSSHLFYGFQLLEWCFAEEPYKLVWAIRNDGVLLSLTFLREQELVAWSHRDTQGSYKSIASITEASAIGNVDAVYTVARRAINGATVQYIERFVEQYYPEGVTDSWQVDAGIQYNGSAVTSFSGAHHLSGAACVGVATKADGTFYDFEVTVSSTGTFTVSEAATRVTIGLAYTPQLRTLPIDTGDPTIQGRMKFLPEVDLKVVNTLGLQIGSYEDNLVDMDDLIVGNIGKQTNELVTNLVTGDVLQTLDPQWTVPGQYLIQQSRPYPASILGVIPKIEVANPKD